MKTLISTLQQHIEGSDDLTLDNIKLLLDEERGQFSTEDWLTVIEALRPYEWESPTGHAIYNTLVKLVDRSM